MLVMQVTCGATGSKLSEVGDPCPTWVARGPRRDSSMSGTTRGRANARRPPFGGRLERPCGNRLLIGRRSRDCRDSLAPSDKQDSAGEQRKQHARDDEDPGEKTEVWQAGHLCVVAHIRLDGFDERLVMRQAGRHVREDRRELWKPLEQAGRCREA